MLRFTDVSVQYGAGIRAVEHATFSVTPGKILAIIGGNGAGKTTLMRAASGTLSYHGGSMTGGRIELEGNDITRMPPHRIVTHGLSLVPEGRHVFGELSVEQNLLAGASTVRDSSTRARRMREAFDRFDVLAQRRDQAASLLSGGEQQMLAIARGLMSGPRILLLDEPTLGLAPQAVRRIGEALRAINASGTTIVLVEQNAAMALSIADDGVVVGRGAVELSGSAESLRASDDIKRMYLGGSSEEDDDVPDQTTPVATLSRWTS